MPYPRLTFLRSDFQPAADRNRRVVGNHFCAVCFQASRRKQGELTPADRRPSPLGLPCRRIQRAGYQQSKASAQAAKNTAAFFQGEFKSLPAPAPHMVSVWKKAPPEVLPEELFPYSPLISVSPQRPSGPLSGRCSPNGPSGPCGPCGRMRPAGGRSACAGPDPG